MQSDILNERVTVCAASGTGEQVLVSLQGDALVCEDARFTLLQRDVIGSELDVNTRLPCVTVVSYEEVTPGCGACGGARGRQRRELLIQFVNGNRDNCVHLARKWHCALSWWATGHDVPVEVKNATLEAPDKSPDTPSTAATELPLPNQRRFMVCVNPASGTGKATAIYRNVVHTIFTEAGINVDTLFTTHANHALEWVRDEEDLASKYDGIVVVSGDGLLFEILQGAMQRSDWDRVMQRVAFGIVPAGSGNGLAKSVSHTHDEVHGPLNATFLIAKGYVASMDIFAVDSVRHGVTDPSQIKRLYSFLSLEWAMASDIDVGSDNKRWMGEFRFTWEAVARIIKNRIYRGRLSYLPVETNPPNTKVRCANDPAVVKPRSYWDVHEPGVKTPISSMPPLNDPVPENWTVVEDDFWMMWNCNVAWISGDGHTAPNAHVSDGLCQLSCIRRNSPSPGSRKVMLDYLLGVDGGKHENNDAVEMVPTTKYRLEPLSHHDVGYVALDGEVVDYGPIQVEVLPSLAKILGVLPNSSDERSIATE